ncbi:PREDICTED: uncharacterized protein LOC107351183 [Acropora digitifera]|uniref:uncharacterized protein LOC107351183 n=1 Tax=Acropora digitifera TaxID=70779 RepID=UPI00077A345B|nr:PREDICTED: uncharacterized protein LOC107351183 [Acropora digitifera]
MMLTLQRYDLKVKYRPRVELSVADALSRSYLPETAETLIPDLEVNEVHLTTHLPISPEKYVEMQEATAADPVMHALTSIVQHGWPKSKKDVPNALPQYWDYKDELSSVDGLLFRARHLIVPHSWRKEMLDRIHESHQGIVNPKYPQANGEAERAVQTIESLFKKAQDPFKALLNYRNTPLEGTGLLPAQLLMGRRLKTTLPTHTDLQKTHEAQEVKEHFQKRKLQEKVYYDKGSGKELQPLNNGEKVTLQHGNNWVPATVISKHHTPRSYIVQTQEGQKYRRNLNKCRPSKDKPTASLHDQPKASPNIHTSKVNKVPVPTTEASPPQVQKPPVRSRSGRLVRKPAYHKDYEH